MGVGRQMKKSFHGMGKGLILMFPARTSLPYEGLSKGRIINLWDEDAFLLKREIPTIGAVCPEYSKGNVELKNGKNVYSTLIRGVYPIYESMRNEIPQRGGRFVNDRDIEERRRVIFLGSKLKREVFRDEEAVGRHVLVNRIPFLVIGILKEKIQNSDYGERDEIVAFVPATTFSAVFGAKYIENFIVEAVDSRNNKEIVREILRVLGKKHKFDSKDTDALMTWDMMEFETMFEGISLGFSLFMGLVGAFTLIVGGIGVSNIMNVVVEERTREIGLKMALGAKKRFVLGQFLFETLFITFIGGGLGMGLSYLILSFWPVTKFEEAVGHPVFSIEIALVAVVLLGLIGFFSGFAPARRAANLNPVEALRS